MTQTKQIVVAALFAATASGLRFRPPVGSVPWQQPLTTPDFESPGNPVNYFVPDFGVDRGIIDATESIAAAEKQLKKKWNATFSQKKNPLNPRDYFVPDFGVDKDIKQTTASIAQSEKAVGSKMKADFGANGNKENPRGYFVPDFGVDHEIMYTQSNIKNAEGKLKHKLQADFGANGSKVNPRDYKVPDFGVDRDIIWTKGSIAQSEKVLNKKWNPVKKDGAWVDMPAVGANSSYTYSQTSPEQSEVTKTFTKEAKVAADAATAKAQSIAQTEEAPVSEDNVLLASDPICSSAGCTQYKQTTPLSHPIDYFVPNFGVDHDILGSHEALAWTENDLGRKWEWKKEPKPDVVDYKIEPLDVDMQASLGNLAMEEGIHGVWEYGDSSNVMLAMQSDPICSSAGCTQYKQPTPIGHPIDYFVPNFGVDHNILDANEGLAWAEKDMGRKMEWKKQEPKEKEYKVPDFGVDEEIKYAQEGLKWAESDLGDKWTPTQDKNGYWNVPEAASASSYSYNPDSFTDHLAGAVY